MLNLPYSLFVVIKSEGRGGTNNNKKFTVRESGIFTNMFVQIVIFFDFCPEKGPD